MAEVCKMFVYLIRCAPQFAQSVFTTKRVIFMTLFVTYIWDAIRREYIESRKEDYEIHYSKQARPRKSETYRLQSDAQVYAKLHDARDVTRGHHKSRSIQIAAYNRPHVRPDRAELDNLVYREFDCPLPPMPKFLRMYKIFSTIFVFYSTLRYALVSSIQYEWLRIDKRYACYLPGRLAIIADEGLIFETPWFGFVICGYHVAWRTMWHYANRLELDCLMFLCYDKDTVSDRQFEILTLNNQKISPEVAYRKYLCSKIFYERHTNQRGRDSYVMKPYRTVTHYEKLQYLTMKFLLLHCILIGAVIVPMILFGFYTLFSHEFFDLSYPSCKSVPSSSSQGNASNWSFNDRFRLGYLPFDMLDCFILWTDSTAAMLLTYSAALIVSHDINLRFDSLCDRLSDLNDRFRYLLFDDYGRKSSSSIMTHSTMKFLLSLEIESDQIFNEAITLFDQIRSADEFMRRFTSFTIYGGLITNISYQVLSSARKIPRGQIGIALHVFLLIQINAILISVFLTLARPHNRARVFYTKICSAMALCPNVPRTKMLWQWLLEYYHIRSPRYTLHIIGKSYSLSNLNILRCASWFLTCTLIILNLMRNRVPMAERYALGMLT